MSIWKRIKTKYDYFNVIDDKNFTHACNSLLQQYVIKTMNLCQLCSLINLDVSPMIWKIAVLHLFRRVFFISNCWISCWIWQSVGRLASWICSVEFPKSSFYLIQLTPTSRSIFDSHKRYSGILKWSVFYILPSTYCSQHITTFHWKKCTPFRVIHVLHLNENRIRQWHMLLTFVSL